MDKADLEALKNVAIIAALVALLAFVAIIGLGIGLGIATRLFLWAAWG